MTIASTITGLLITAGITTYGTLELEKTLKDVGEIQYEATEEITKHTGAANARDIVRRNDARRRALCIKLNRVLNGTGD